MSWKAGRAEGKGCLLASVFFLKLLPNSTNCQWSTGDGLRGNKILTDRKNVGASAAIPLLAVDPSTCCLSPTARPLLDQGNFLPT